MAQLDIAGSHVVRPRRFAMGPLSSGESGVACPGFARSPQEKKAERWRFVRDLGQALRENRAVDRSTERLEHNANAGSKLELVQNTLKLPVSLHRWNPNQDLLGIRPAHLLNDLKP